MTLTELRKLAEAKSKVKLSNPTANYPMGNPIGGWQRRADDVFAVAFWNHANSLLDVVEAAKISLQEQLNDSRCGTVDEWGDDLEEEIGWGKDCALYKLGRALTALEAIK